MRLIWAMFCSLLVGFAWGRWGHVYITGYIRCSGSPLFNHLVTLMEEDTDRDDQLAKTYTQQGGFFKLTGGESELRFIEPYVAVQHQCNTPGDEETFKYNIPHEMITYDREPPIKFHLNIELNQTYKPDVTA